MYKKVLIDVSLTGGRGPAKKVYEMTKILKEMGIEFYVLCDAEFEFKLKALGIKVDFVVKTKINDKIEIILEQFYQKIKKIDFDLLIKFGARVAGPKACLRLKKPYLIIDGGLPDRLDDEQNSLYSKEVYQQAISYYVTTQFDWQYPDRLPDLRNVSTIFYPLSEKTKKFLDELKNFEKKEIIKKYQNKFPEIKEISGRIFINLVFTGDFLVNKFDRKTHGGWLTTDQYDECVGYIRRLFFDLGENKNKKFVLFVDQEIIGMVNDIIKKYQNIKAITYRRGWSYELEIIMKRLADINISRATNYQPFLAYLSLANTITTPVPANGYMDEDIAAIEYEKRGLTKLIEYNDEQYVKKVLEFYYDKKQQKKIRDNLIFEVQSFYEKNNIKNILKDMKTGKQKLISYNEINKNLK